MIYSIINLCWWAGSSYISSKLWTVTAYFVDGIVVDYVFKPRIPQRIFSSAMKGLSKASMRRNQVIDNILASMPE